MSRTADGGYTIPEGPAANVLSQVQQMLNDIAGGNAGLASPVLSGGAGDYTVGVTTPGTEGDKRKRVLAPTGGVTGIKEMVMPVTQCERFVLLYNLTTGGFALKLKASGQSTDVSSVSTGKARWFFHNGTKWLAAGVEFDPLTGGASSTSVTGSGTANKVAKFSASTTLADSQITDDGTVVGLGGAGSGTNKKAHVHGGLSVGSGYSSSALPANGLAAEGPLLSGRTTQAGGEQLSVDGGVGGGYAARLRNTAVNGNGLYLAACDSSAHLAITVKNRAETVTLLELTGAGTLTTSGGFAFTTTTGGVYGLDLFANSASGYGARIRAGSSVSHPLLLMQDSASSDRFAFYADGTLKQGGTGRIYQNLPNSAPSDGDLAVGQGSLYLDQTNHKVMIRVKYSDGTLKTGEVCTLT